MRHVEKGLKAKRPRSRARACIPGNFDCSFTFAKASFVIFELKKSCGYEFDKRNWVRGVDKP